MKCPKCGCNLSKMEDMDDESEDSQEAPKSSKDSGKKHIVELVIKRSGK